MRRGVLLGALCLAGCGGAMGGGAGLPTPATAFRPDDRVVLGNFARVNAIAASFDRVFVAFPSAVGLWRPQTQRWEVPRTPPRPGMLRDVRLAIQDLGDQSLWLATTQGWIHYTPTIERWEEGPLPGTPTAIAVDPSDALGGAWFRIGGQWVRQSRIGGAPMPAAPSRALQIAPTIEDALRDVPQLRTIAPRLLTGPDLVQGRLTAAAPLADGNRWLLGTSNLGVLQLDRIGATAPPLALGLRGTSVGAIALEGDGIWVATDAELRSSADLAFLPLDLSSSTPIDGRPPFGLPFAAARRMVVADRTLWLGTDQGVVRITTPERRITRWGDSDGLPDPRTLSLVAHQGRMVAGTMRGLAELQDDGRALRLAPRFIDPAYALLSRGDTLWVGTPFGLRAWLSGDESLSEPEGLARFGGAHVPVRGIGYVADTLVAMTESQLLWRDPASGAWSAGPVLTGLGRLQVFTVTPDGIWVGGDRGAGFVRPTTPLLRSLQAPTDLPGSVTAIASAGSYLWIGTTEGLVRLRLQGR